MLDADLMSSPSPLPALLDRVRAGSDVLLTVPGDAGRVLLDDAAAALAPECRTVRVSAREPGLSLSGLMAQVAGTPDPEAHDDAVLELGYQILAVPDGPDGRIVWLIDGAELLQRPALRYVQHMVRSARALILVMAAAPAFAELLASDDFAPLRDRLQPAAVMASVPVPAPVTALAARADAKLAPIPLARPVLETRRSGPFLLLAGTAMAASVAIGVWIGRTHWNPSAAMPATASLAPAHVAAIAAPVAVAPPAHKAEPPAVAASAAPPPPPSPTSTAEAEPAARTAPPAAAEPKHDKVKVAETPQPSEPAHPRRTRRPENHGREVASIPRRLQPARLTENPPPLPGRDYDEPEPNWAYAPRPAPTWQPRAYQGYAGGYEPQGSYIGTYSTDRYGYRTFRFDP